MGDTGSFARSLEPMRVSSPERLKMNSRIASSLLVFLLLAACNDPVPATSSSGIGKATAKVQVGSDGLTAEQRNIQERLKADNAPGSVKHLYIISAYSGQVLIYSTVRGKVTSSGKRLTPTSVNGSCNAGNGCAGGFVVDIGKAQVMTNEVLQDDGTYGGSVEYLYWWDAKGVYHQHYVTGGQIPHISSEPLVVKSIIVNMELNKAESPEPAEEPVKSKK